MPTWVPPGVSARNGCWHFNDEERGDIWFRVVYQGERLRPLARDYGVSASVIQRVINQLAGRG